MSRYDTQDIIYALATPWARSGLAVIRISGAGCKEALAPYFSRPAALLGAPNATMVHGSLIDEAAARIDEVVLAINTDGHGYTAEEAIEISCHGSLAVIQAILALLGRIGMRSAEAGEFTFRAFLHGRVDLTQAEAVEELVSSVSQRSRSLSLSRLEGKLRQRIDMLKDTLLTILAAVEVQLDYAEDELDEFVFPTQALTDLIASIGSLADTYQIGRLYKRGAKVVLAGSTNVGKSSLFNLLLKEERSIVSPYRGTTRDYIEADLEVGGIPIRLYDTAGLRESEDLVEQEGVVRSERLIGQADLVIHLVDSTDLGHIPEEDGRTIVVYNKSDLARIGGDKLAISAQSGEGVARLLEVVEAYLKRSIPEGGDEELVIEGERQWRLLGGAKGALLRALHLVQADAVLDVVAVELGEALSNLGELTGEVRSDDILERIFSGFCVGK
ncbi:MAG: tRNA uridine-5-carboxymethylaminomethyl(34) synthesis GTPase MnmE [Sphaerochaeta sp.]|jgi:tRNA modification GTPase|nr:tRNA uridine-5-carboxymethylaminomethyl(34) synthesis GTPase MnmE [Sphaerochaeta sp.]MDX9914550.1 tRNA uridine-5-carboxymethylaminomethyl(34) synthesis GTPase MnmE [Sphaerochaeta sp.]